MDLVKPVTPGMRERVRQFICSRWGSDLVVSRGRLHRPAELPGYARLQGEEVRGLVTCCIDGDECEIVTLDSM